MPIKIDGKLSSVEFIDAAGNKVVLAGSATAGGYWAPTALPPITAKDLTIVIAEGIATALTLYESWCYATVAARSLATSARLRLRCGRCTQRLG
ncbi:hypothetical protein [Chromatium okenii]|uniref:hypothetical protein n=1 Tax=Chromatium okenii TaxID=61644 RepID=UPI0011B091F2|nr:hypothetical protein [Chromatium okenii]